jgi:hypothetical protein
MHPDHAGNLFFVEAPGSSAELVVEIADFLGSLRLRMELWETERLELAFAHVPQPLNPSR